MLIAYLLALMLDTTTPAPAIQEVIRPADEVKASELTVENKIRLSASALGLPADEMVRIAKCESGLRQFATSTVLLRGQANPKDVGVFQINETYHLEAAKKLGLDIHSEDGNIAYAMKLYQQNGNRDWNWSKSCWLDK